MYRGLIAIDLDGTILQLTYEVSAKDREALKKAHDLGYLIAICSGRSAHLVKREIVKWKIKEYIDIIAGCNGAEYYDPSKSEEVEMLGYITKEDIKEVFDILATEGNYGFTWYSTTAVYTSSDHPRADRLGKQIELPVTHIAKDKVVEAFPDKWPKTVIYLENPSKRYIKELIYSKKQKAYDLVFTLDVVMEVIPEGINKGTILLEIAKRYNIAKKDIMAIGDEENDAEMLRNSGFAVAMGNAVESLKEIADYITADLEDNGFAEAVEVFIKRNQNRNIQGGHI